MSGRKSHKRSNVWHNFTEMEENKAKCEFCSVILSTVGGSTGNLTRHLRTKHPFALNLKSLNERTHSATDADDININISSAGADEQVNENVGVGPSSDDIASTNEGDLNKPSTSTSTGITKRKRASAAAGPKQSTITNMEFVHVLKPVRVDRAKQLDKQLVKMIVKEYQPFRIVEDKEFRKFVHMLCPGYSLPSRKNISFNMIPQLINTVKEKVSDKLKETTAVCLSTDGWTSFNNESFIAVTVHYIDKQSKLCSNLLGCTKFDDRHTTDNLASFLNETVREWNLINKVAAVVSDNAANITGAIHTCGWRLVPCFAHTLNLAVQAGLEAIKVPVKKVKSIVEYFKRSSHALAKLHITQEQMDLPRLKLKQDVSTRWNSTYDMITRFLSNKEPIIATLALINTELNMLTPAEWDILDTSKKILEIFNDITIEISAEKTVSLSKVILFVSAINRHLNKYQADTTLALDIQCLNMITILKSEMLKRFRNIEDNELVTQATFLDPRFKKYGFIHEHKFEATYNTIRNKLAVTNISNEIQTNAEKSSINKSDNSYSTAVWGDFDSKVEQLLAVNNPTAAGIVEMDKYLQEPLIGRLEDPLIFWEEKRKMYPRLYQLVTKRLCILATSVPCERLFSKAGQILNDKRSRLSANKVSQILFLNSNLD